MSYVAETVVEGKSVAAWSTKLDAVMEAAENIYLETRRFVVIDLTKDFPGAVCAAVRQWKAAGKPTEFSETQKEVDRLRKQADTQSALAQLEDSKVRDAEKVGKPREAKQHRAYAASNREKAARFLEQADEVVAVWTKAHPKKGA